MRKSIGLFMMFCVGMVWLVGCASDGQQAPTKVESAPSAGSPEWVMKGSGAFGGEQGRVFYGVASAYGMKNYSLLRSTADNRARNEVSKVFQFYTASLQKDYMASTMAGDPNVTSEEQHVEQAVKTVTSMTLSGVEIVDHWQDPKTGEFFSLARLDLSAFKDTAEKQKDLDQRVKEYIRQNAEKLHGQLEKEEDKMKAQGQ